MKQLLLTASFLLCFACIYAQTETLLPGDYTTAYEQEIFNKKDATHLEMLLAMGSKASAQRTQQVKQEIDAFVQEIKSSNLMRMSEEKQMKELHQKVRNKFLTTYKYITPFHEIFETGQYNCVSATALFALVLEQLDIPYNIQQLPTHVYIMAYPDTKAISVEMTAIKDASYMPARKDVSKAVGILIDLGLATSEDVKKAGETAIYNMFYNPNGVVDLEQLAGIQYLNEAITALNEGHYETAFTAICKTEKLYDVKRTQLFKTEVLYYVLDDASFDSMKDIRYLVGYANLKKADQLKVYYQYAKFITDQLVNGSNKALADSSFTYLSQNIKDTAMASKLKGVYYFGMSEYYSNAYNLKKRLEYAELANTSYPNNPPIQLWLIQSIVKTLEKYDTEESIEKLDEYAVKYPYLKKHNMFLMYYYYACVEVSSEYYEEEGDPEEGKKYFDMAVKTYDSMEDKEVLDTEIVGWLYADAGAYYMRLYQDDKAMEILQQGLKLAPDHERILARIEIINDRKK